MFILASMLAVQEPPIINVWIHGTKPSKIGPSFIEWLEPEAIRNFFYCKPGLHLATSLDCNCNHYAIAKKLAETSSNMFPLETFYTFGWDGDISLEERLKAAQELFDALKKCIKRHSCNGQKPFLRIISHSHGGNVVFYMARLKNGDPGFIVNELILLACPIQQETACHINDSLFQTVYSIHSHGDFIQILDPQGWPSLKRSLKQIFSISSREVLKDIINQFQHQPFFSERHFKQNYSNLTQIHLTYNGKTLPHIEFMTPSFAGKLPKVLRMLKKWKTGDIVLPMVENDVVVNIDTTKKIL